MKNRNFKFITVSLAAALSIAAILFAADIKAVFTSDSEQGVYYSWNPSWQFSTPGTGTFFFTAKAGNDIHIAISDKAETDDPMYEIVIGGWGNSQSAIRRVSQGEVLKSTSKSVKNPGAEGKYWVSLDATKKTISAGYGNVVGKEIIIVWKDPEFLAGSKFFALSSWDTPIEYSNISLAPEK